ncbi:aminotransferase class V-fold PLP-dependent enzyme [Anderseniella sp. Alg231-50]|uniref:aminotransferase class V-fold PLP-dependent enzyme n=1 Tax=Anderseniella sp. Alg231-50 TaxID=1922226 RepID=UPI000D55CECA
MTLANGHRHLAIPGPTNMPDEVLNALHQASVDIYGGSSEIASRACMQDLKEVFRTRGSMYIYAANGHGAWEAALTNTLSKGDKVLVLASGLFPIVWGENAAGLGIETEVLEERRGRAVDLEAVEARLAADTGHEFKAILMVQADTATGVVNDVKGVRTALDQASHPAMLMVDTIASLGCMEFDMDGWGVDVTVAGAQKGLMTPPGLSFTAVSAKAKQAHKTAGLVTNYWDWTFRDGKDHYMWYAGTPPVQMVFALRKALEMLLEEGLENAIHRHAVLAGATRAAVETWTSKGATGFAVSEPAERSNSVTCMLMPKGESSRVLEYCEHKLGVTVGRGIGPLDNRAIRIAHMGHVNAYNQLGTLGAIETAMAALDIEHGPGGVQSAIEYIAIHVK